MLKIWLSVFVFGLAAIDTALAAPKARDYPTVIPGPGLPSLAELNVTSRQLQEMGWPKPRGSASNLVSRQAPDRSCGVPKAYTDVDDLIACFHMLETAGASPITITDYDKHHVLCTHGKAQIYASTFQRSTTGQPGPITVSSESTANAVLWVINGCTRQDQTCSGWAASSESEYFMVSAVVAGFFDGK